MYLKHKQLRKNFTKNKTKIGIIIFKSGTVPSTNETRIIFTHSMPDVDICQLSILYYGLISVGTKRYWGLILSPTCKARYQANMMPCAFVWSLTVFSASHVLRLLIKRCDHLKMHFRLIPSDYTAMSKNSCSPRGELHLVYRLDCLML